MKAYIAMTVGNWAWNKWFSCMLVDLLVHLQAGVSAWLIEG